MKLHAFTLFLFLCSALVCSGQSLEKYLPEDYCDKKVVYIKEDIEEMKKMLSKELIKLPAFWRSMRNNSENEVSLEIKGLQEGLQEQMYAQEQYLKHCHEKHSNFTVLDTLLDENTYTIKFRFKPHVVKVFILGWVYITEGSFSLYKKDTLLMENINLKKVRKYIKKTCEK